MTHSLSLGELNNRILLTVAAINILIDHELRLEELGEDLEALRKRRDSYVQALKASEERAQALRAKYTKLIDEISASNLTESQLCSRLALAQRHFDAQPNAFMSLLSVCRSPPAASPPVLSSVEPNTLRTALPQKGYLGELKRRWRRKQRHLRPDTHTTLRHAEARLTQLSALLEAKRQDSLRVQRGIRAGKENIEIVAEEIYALQQKLSIPLWHLCKDKYEEYCSLLQTHISKSQSDRSLGVAVKLPQVTTFNNLNIKGPDVMCWALLGRGHATANSAKYKPKVCFDKLAANVS